MVTLSVHGAEFITCGVLGKFVQKMFARVGNKNFRSPKHANLTLEPK